MASEGIGLANALIKTVNLESWMDAASKEQHAYKVIIACSGYEERNAKYVSLLLDRNMAGEDIRFIIIGFKDHAQELSREKNDQYYKGQGLQIVTIDSNDAESFETFVLSCIRETLEKAGEQPVEVHIDYSCMPRDWYCRLPLYAISRLRIIDKLYMWYTPGKYQVGSYPTAGVDDFMIFSGRPSLRPKGRAHFFGLGLDRLRSLAIASVLDPSCLVCYYSDPGTSIDIPNRVREDNKEVLRLASHIFTVPVHDFEKMFGLIYAAVNDFMAVGDVVLVPDGPKPMILASSLLSQYIDKAGLVCFHVRRHKERFKPVDVIAIGEPLGLLICRREISNVKVSD